MSKRLPPQPVFRWHFSHESEPFKDGTEIPNPLQRVGASELAPSPLTLRHLDYPLQPVSKDFIGSAATPWNRNRLLPPNEYYGIAPVTQPPTFQPGYLSTAPTNLGIDENRPNRQLDYSVHRDDSLQANSTSQAPEEFLNATSVVKLEECSSPHQLSRTPESNLQPATPQIKPGRPSRLTPEAIKALKERWESDPKMPSYQYRHEFAREHNTTPDTVYKWFYKRVKKARDNAARLGSAPTVPSPSAHEVSRASSPFKASLPNKGPAYKTPLKLKLKDDEDKFPAAVGYLPGNETTARPSTLGNNISPQDPTLLWYSILTPWNAGHTSASYQTQLASSSTSGTKGVPLGGVSRTNFLSQSVYDIPYDFKSLADSVVSKTGSAPLLKTPTSHAGRPFSEANRHVSYPAFKLPSKRKLGDGEENRTPGLDEVGKTKRIQRQAQSDLHRPSWGMSASSARLKHDIFLKPLPPSRKTQPGVSQSGSTLVVSSPCATSGPVYGEYSEYADIKFGWLATTDFHNVEARFNVLSPRTKTLEAKRPVSSDSEVRYEVGASDGSRPLDDKQKLICERLSAINREFGL